MARSLKLVVLLAVIVTVLTASSGASAPLEASDRMLETVKYLSGPEFKGRGIGTPELDKAAAFIVKKFESFGLMPGGDGGGWFQEWTDPDLRVKMRNVVGFLPGRDPLLARESVVIGAHYDHLGVRPSRTGEQPRIHPGADDNASGVAVLLELANRLPLADNVERAVVFVAFTGEEEGRKGSQYYVRHAQQFPVSKCVAMINLDTVGRMEKGKLIVLGGGSAKEWGDVFSQAGRKQQVEISLSTQDLDSSDQISFQAAGVPAVQLFAGPHLEYHTPADTADKIDAKGLGKIAEVARAAALYLAITPKPLTLLLAASPNASAGPRSERKSSIGIIPDFTYNESGVRLVGTAPGSGAETAGLRQGDIIVRAGNAQVVTLKDLSDVLKASKPGERLPVTFQRNGKTLQVNVEVKEK